VHTSPRRSLYMVRHLGVGFGSPGEFTADYDCFGSAMSDGREEREEREKRREEEEKKDRSDRLDHDLAGDLADQWLPERRES